MDIDNRHNQNTLKQNDIPEITEVVYGYRKCETSNAKWLCLDEIYEKFHRPYFYNIGGTYLNETGDYWFSYKTEQVGNIYLLHLFFCNQTKGSYTFSVSSSTDLRTDRKNRIAYLSEFLKEHKFKNVTENVQLYVTTYSFSEFDVEFLKKTKLYIAVSIPVHKTGCPEVPIVKLRHFGELLTDTSGSDFIMESGDGIKFHVHKAVLAVNSDVFKAMLCYETAENQNSHVKLVDVNGDELCSVIEYMYTGTVKDMESCNFMNILIIADRYDLKGLKTLSEHILSQKITPEILLDTLVLADMLGSDFLKKTAFKFIKKNPSILKSETFKDIKNVDLIQELCKYIAGSE